MVSSAKGSLVFPEFPTKWSEEEQSRLDALQDLARTQQEIYGKYYTPGMWAEKPIWSRAASELAETASKIAFPFGVGKVAEWIGRAQGGFTPQQADIFIRETEAEIQEFKRKQSVVEYLPTVKTVISLAALEGKPVQDEAYIYLLFPRLKPSASWDVRLDLTEQERGWILEYGKALAGKSKEEIMNTFSGGDMPPEDFATLMEQFSVVTQGTVPPHVIMSSVALSKDQEEIRTALRAAYPPEVDDEQLAFEETLQQNFNDLLESHGLTPSGDLEQDLKELNKIETATIYEEGVPDTLILPSGRIISVTRKQDGFYFGGIKIANVDGEGNPVAMTAAEEFEVDNAPVPSGEGRTEHLVRSRFPTLSEEGVAAFLLLDGSEEAIISWYGENFSHLQQPISPSSLANLQSFITPTVSEPGFFGQIEAGLAGGVSDLASALGGAFRWMGWEGAGKWLSEKGDEATRKYPNLSYDISSFNWKTSWRTSEFWALGVTRTIPFMMYLLPVALLAYYGGTAVTGAVAARIGLGAFGTKVLTTIGGGVAGGIAARTTESAFEAGSTFDQVLDSGGTHEEADKIANQIFWDNMKLTGLDAAQIAVAFAPPMLSVPAKGITRGLFTVARVGGKMTIVGLTEAGEEYYQTAVERRALGEEDPWKFDEEAQYAATVGGIMGLGMGMGGDILSGIIHDTKDNMTLEDNEQFERDLSDTTDALVSKGVPKAEAERTGESQALDNFAETPEGESLVKQVVEVTEEKVLNSQIKDPNKRVHKRETKFLKGQLKNIEEELAVVQASYDKQVASLEKELTPSKKIGIQESIAKSEKSIKELGSKKGVIQGKLTKLTEVSGVGKFVVAVNVRKDFAGISQEREMSTLRLDRKPDGSLRVNKEGTVRVFFKGLEGEEASGFVMEVKARQIELAQEMAATPEELALLKEMEEETSDLLRVKRIYLELRDTPLEPKARAILFKKFTKKAAASFLENVAEREAEGTKAEVGMKERWDGMDRAEKRAVAEDAGYAPSTARAISKLSWDELNTQQKFNLTTALLTEAGEGGVLPIVLDEVEWGEGMTPVLQEKFTAIVEGLNVDWGDIRLRKVEINPVEAPEDASFDLSDKTLYFHDEGKITEHITTHELGHLILDSKLPLIKGEEDVSFVHDIIKVYEERTPATGEVPLVGRHEEAIAEDFAAYMGHPDPEEAGVELTAEKRAFFQKHFPRVKPERELFEAEVVSEEGLEGLTPEEITNGEAIERRAAMIQARELPDGVPERVVPRGRWWKQTRDEAGEILRKHLYGADLTNPLSRAMVAAIRLGDIVAYNELLNQLPHDDKGNIDWDAHIAVGLGKAKFSDVSSANLNSMPVLDAVTTIDGGRFGGALRMKVYQVVDQAVLASLQYQGGWTTKLLKLENKVGLDRPSWIRFRQRADFNNRTVAVISNIGFEDTILTTEELLAKEGVARALRGLSREQQITFAEYGRGLRIMFDEVLAEINSVRQTLGREIIPYRRNYLPWIYKINIWGKLLGIHLTPDFIASQTMAPEYMLSQKMTPSNLRALERKGGLANYSKIKDVRKLFLDYVAVASREMFYTPAVSNAKAASRFLHNQGLESPGRYLENWVQRSMLGVPDGLARWWKESVPSVVRTPVQIIRNRLNPAVFGLNFAWNIFVQTSSIALSVLHIGTLWTTMGSQYLWNPSVRHWVQNNVPAYIIKQKGKGSIVYQDVGQVISEARSIDRSPLETVDDWVTFLTRFIEREITGVTAAAGYFKGKRLGYKGAKLVAFASDNAAKTQSMYDPIHLPLAYSPVFRLFVPFQTFCFEALTRAREMTGLKFMRAGAWQSVAASTPEGKSLLRTRMMRFFEFMVAIFVINMIGETLNRRQPWEYSSFIPAFNIMMMGQDPNNPWNLPMPYRYSKEFWYGAKATWEYGNFEPITLWALRWHFPAGSQSARTLQGIIASIHGEVRDVSGDVVVEDGVPFELQSGEWLRAVTLGVWNTQTGREIADLQRGGLPVSTQRIIKNIWKWDDQLGTSVDGKYYTLRDYYIAVGSSIRELGVPTWQVLEDPVFYPPLAMLAIQSELIFEEYYDLPENQRVQYRKDFPVVDALLCFWGKVQNPRTTNGLNELAHLFDLFGKDEEGKDRPYIHWKGLPTVPDWINLIPE